MPEVSTPREAKEFLIDTIVAEAAREKAPLAEIERKMLFYSETDSTLPDMQEVNALFERDYDASEYESKIGALVRNFRAFARKNDRATLQRWKQAVGAIQHEDHYLLVLIAGADQRALSTNLLRPLKLILAGLGLALAALSMGYLYLGR